MTGTVLFAVICLAAYRLTRLVTLDTIGDKARGWWWSKFDPMTHPLGQLVHCAWCTGFWAAGLVVGVVAVWWTLPLPLLWWAGAATVCGFLGKLDNL